MRRFLNGALALASAALALGFGAIFLARWGVRGLIVGGLFAGALAFAWAAATGAIEGRGARLNAALIYVAIGGWAAAVIVDAFKNDLIRDLLYLQAGAAALGLVVCALPRRNF